MDVSRFKRHRQVDSSGTREGMGIFLDAKKLLGGLERLISGASWTDLFFESEGSNVWQVSQDNNPRFK